MPSTKIRPGSAPAAAGFLSGRLQNSLSVFFFAALFFFCSADQFFAVRVLGFNFRFGQLLLLAGACLVLYGKFGPVRDGSLNEQPGLKAFLNWLPFFLIYALAAFLSSAPKRTLVKEAWAFFNIGGSALVFLTASQWKPAQKRGMFYGILAVAAVLWVQFIAIYWFGACDSATSATASGQSTPIPGFGGFLGFAQLSGQVQDLLIFRPNAFYYEPSYAGCAMTFAFPSMVLLGMEETGNFFKSLLAPAMVLGAIFMTSSRSGILGISLSLFVIVLGCLVNKRKAVFIRLSKVFLTALLLLGLLCVSPRAQKFADFVIGSFIPSSLGARIGDPNSSEGWRLTNVKRSLKLWGEHPVLGMGVLPLSHDTGTRGLGMSSESMWLEVAVESGTLGLLAFLYAIGRILLGALGKNPAIDRKILVAGALTAHWLVSMNFTSTFPRLDYWLIFFFYICLLTRKEPTL